MRSQDISICHHFVVFDVDGTQHVLVAFANNSQELSRQLNFRSLEPGQPVCILGPKVICNIREHKTPFLNQETHWHLVHIRTCLVCHSNNCVLLDFSVTNLRVTQPVQLDNVCRGKLCDSQFFKKTGHFR